MYKDSKRGRLSIPIIIAMKYPVLQYLKISYQALEDVLIDRLSFQGFSHLTFSRPSAPFYEVTTL
ncbi:hypothetical protein ACFL1R_00265 [Candidatus Latescibacterota bacterium]